MQTETLDTELTPSVLRLFETNKDQRKSFVDNIIQKLDDGIVNPLEVHLQVKAMEDIITQLTSTDKEKNKTNLETAVKYKSYLSEAFTNYCNGQKSFGFHNATFRQMEAGTKYDFTKCGDNEWNILNSQIEELTEKRKKREEFLKTVPSSGIDIRYDEDEMITIYPPSKTSTTTVSVSLK